MILVLSETMMVMVLLVTDNESLSRDSAWCIREATEMQTLQANIDEIEELVDNNSTSEL